MKLSQRLQAALRTFLEDIFREDDETLAVTTGSSAHSSSSAEGERPQEALIRLLGEAQARMDSLRVELANAQERQNRIEREWQEALGQAQAISESVDEALLVSNEDLARTRLAQLQPLQSKVDELEALNQTYQQLVNTLQETVRVQQVQLDKARRKSTALIERQRSAETLEELARLRSELNRQISSLQTEIDDHQEQIARREDRTAALQEIQHYKQMR